MNKNIIFIIFSALSLLVICSEDNGNYPEKCLKEYKNQQSQVKSVQFLDLYESQKELLAIQEIGAQQIKIRESRAGYIYRQVNTTQSEFKIHSLKINNTKLMIVNDQKDQITLYNYYYGVLLQTLTFENCQQITSIFQSSEQEIIVGIKQTDNSFSLQVLAISDLELTLKKSYKIDISPLFIHKIANYTDGEILFSNNERFQVLNLADSKISDFAVNGNSLSSFDRVLYLQKNDSSQFIVLQKDKQVEVYDIKKQKTLGFNTKSNIVYINVMSHDNNILVLALDTNRVELWDWAQSKIYRSYGFKEEEAKQFSQQIDYSALQDKIIIGADKAVMILDAKCLYHEKDNLVDELGVKLAYGIGLGVPLFTLLLLGIMIFYNRKLDEKENYFSPDELSHENQSNKV